ncbi:MAG: bifunctional riboflavin kinase/FAD synthetase, partial [Clostridioides sp.]|nr:bifunctional riboflavin kinase/FAD synthetase [Clostridioides sp.]
MKVFKSLEDIKDIENSTVTIGNFDGVHIGHQVLLYNTVKRAKSNSMKSVVFTFENHPANYFKQGSVKNIISNNEKLKIFESMGIDIAVVIPFDKYMTEISPEEFIENILLEKLKARFIIVGHDFNFAKHREGNSQMLKNLEGKYGFNVDIISPVIVNGNRVSSTLIRKFIAEGKFKNIKDYLSKNYTMTGEVVRSRQIGRTIGFPTANIKIDENMLCPPNGIYVSQVLVGDEVYFGATNIGYNPTVSGRNLSIETYILNF